MHPLREIQDAARFALLALLCGALCSPATGQPVVSPQMDDPERIEVAPIEPALAGASAADGGPPADIRAARYGTALPVERCGDFFIVEATIDGRGPFSMMLDTGASITVLTPEAIAEIDPGRYLDTVHMGELRLSGRIRFQETDMTAISRVLGREVDGILGHPVFRPVVLTYDYPAGEVRYRVGELGDDEPGVAPMSTSKRPFIGAIVGDRKTNVLLDTGFSGSLALHDFDRYTFADEPETIGAILRIDGSYIARAARLESDVTFGAFTLERPVVRNAHGDSLLGQRVLRDFVVSIDQRRGRVRIVRADTTPAPLPIPSPPRIGDALAAVPVAEGMRVARVEPGSPAGEAGLMVGDIITHAGGRALSDRVCRPRGPEPIPGTAVEYTVRRGDATLSVSVEHRVLVR